MTEAIRTELADAANTVAGVKVLPYYAQLTKPGSGVVQLDRVTWPNKFGSVGAWEVVVLLPQGVEAAQRKADELIPLLYEALKPHMQITEATFGRSQLDTSGAGQPCVLISGRREME